MLISSLLCRWLGVKSGHFLLGSVPLSPFMASFLSTPAGDRRREKQCCWRGWGRAPVRTPCPLFLLCHALGLPGFLDPHTPEAARKILVGVSVPICFELVYSMLPVTLANDVSRASLFFVHTF